MDCRSDAAEAIVKATGFADGAKVFFTNAGAESNENAIKIARQYTGKQKIFSQYRCYHGSSAGAGDADRGAQTLLQRTWGLDS